jgi:hypothetical protein
MRRRGNRTARTCARTRITRTMQRKNLLPHRRFILSTLNSRRGGRRETGIALPIDSDSAVGRMVAPAPHNTHLTVYVKHDRI